MDSRLYSIPHCANTFRLFDLIAVKVGQLDKQVNSWPLRWIDTKTALYDFSQFSLNCSLLVHATPIMGWIALKSLVVHIVIKISFGKGRTGFSKNEQNHSQGKNIRFFSIIGLSGN